MNIVFNQFNMPVLLLLLAVMYTKMSLSLVCSSLPHSNMTSINFRSWVGLVTWLLTRARTKSYTSTTTAKGNSLHLTLTAHQWHILYCAWFTEKRRIRSERFHSIIGHSLWNFLKQFSSPRTCNVTIWSKRIICKSKAINI